MIQFMCRRSTVYCEAGSIKMIPDLIKGLGGKRVILFTDKGLMQTGIIDNIKDIFMKCENEDMVKLIGIYDEIEPDARMDKIQACLEFVKENRADALLGVGGGSVLDSIKVVKWMMHNKFDNVYESFGEYPIVIEKWPEAQLMDIPHVAVAATAGTGAEISTTAVVFNDKKGVKRVLMNPYIGADIAILDADVTVSKPKALTAGTGFDAYSHALEAFFSPIANVMSDTYAKEGLRIMSKYLPIACEDGKNIEAREKMLLGNILGISAFGLALTRVPIHNFAHAFGNKYHVAHGLANGVLMPIVIEELPEIYADRCREFLEIVGAENIPEEALRCHAETVKWIKKLRQDTGMPECFPNLEISEAEVEEMVEEVYKDSTSRHYKVDTETIKKIVRKVTTLK